MDLAQALSEIAPIDADLPEDVNARRSEASVIVYEAVGKCAKKAYNKHWSKELPESDREEVADLVHDSLERKGPRPQLRFLDLDQKGRDKAANAYLKKAVDRRFLSFAAKARREVLALDLRRSSSEDEDYRGELEADYTSRWSNETSFNDDALLVDEGDILRRLEEALQRFDMIVAAIQARSSQSTVTSTVAMTRRIKAGEIDTEGACAELGIDRASFYKRVQRARENIQSYLDDPRTNEPMSELDRRFLQGFLEEVRVR